MSCGMVAWVGEGLGPSGGAWGSLGITGDLQELLIFVYMGFGRCFSYLVPL